MKTNTQPKEKKQDDISLCRSCYCMTKTIEGKCGKCKAQKIEGGKKFFNKCEKCGQEYGHHTAEHDFVGSPFSLEEEPTTPMKQKIEGGKKIIQIGIQSYGVINEENAYQYPTMDLVGDEKWAIRWMKQRLTRRGDWIYEPMPSSRTNQFFKRTQMTHDEAMEKFKNILSKWGK